MAKHTFKKTTSKQIEESLKALRMLRKRINKLSRSTAVFG